MAARPNESTRMTAHTIRRAPLALALFCAMSALLAGCAPDATPPAAEATAEAPKAATSGIDLTGIDKAVKPGDDFDAYANGAWKQATEIPADRASLSTGFYVFEKAEKRLSDLVQGLDKANPAAGTDARRIADYYAAYMDEAGIEARGLAPLQATLDGIDAIADKAALSRWFGGFLPTIAFALVAATGNIYYGLWYPIVIALMTFVIGSLFLRETKDVDIRD